MDRKFLNVLIFNLDLILKAKRYFTFIFLNILNFHFRTTSEYTSLSSVPWKTTTSAAAQQSRKHIRQRRLDAEQLFRRAKGYNREERLVQRLERKAVRAAVDAGLADSTPTSVTANDSAAEALPQRGVARNGTD